jgi:STE24 endopeptidase
MISDGLLARCSKEEVEAIFAHELGHNRHHHIGFYMVFAVSFLVFYATLMDALAALGLVAPLEGVLLLELTSAQGVALVAFAAVYWGALFGFISRRLEQQADLFTVRVTGGAQAFMSALRKVGELSSRPVDSDTWRHFSVARRVEFLRRAEEDPDGAARTVRRVKVVQVVLLVLAGLATARLALAYLLF